MRIRKLAIAALIAAVPTATAVAQSSTTSRATREPTREPEDVSDRRVSHFPKWEYAGDTRYAGYARAGTGDRSLRHEARCRQRSKTNFSRRDAGNRCAAVRTVRKGRFSLRRYETTGYWPNTSRR